MTPRTTRAWCRVLHAIALACLTRVKAAYAQAGADSATILVSLLERPIGTESYALRTAGAGLAFTSAMELVERGSPLRLRASLDLRGDFTPTRFRSVGKSYRFVDVDVDLAGDDLAPGVPFFAAMGYAPLAGRALLVRYWERHGRPPALRLVPGTAARTATIELRGVDTVRIGARVVPLRRFAVDGVVWGRETVWLDERDRFAAIVTRIHILPLEGVRSDLAAALPTLQRSSIADRMHDLARLGGDVPALAEGTFALVGATVIDGRGGAPIADATVVVRGGRIAAVGPRAGVTVDSGVRVVDVKGKTVIPGLWDMHAHASQVEWAPAYLAAGVTTIRDMGGEERFLLALRDALAAGQGIGPRILLAGLVDGEAPEAFGVVTAATPAEGRAVVDGYRERRFDQVKLYSLLRPDVVAAIVARAHEGGLSVTGHVPRALGTAASIEAGMDHVAHMPVAGDPASPEVRAVVSALARRRVVVDPTLPWNELLGRAPATAIERFEPGILAAPEALAFSYRSVTNATDSTAAAASLRRQLALVKVMHDAGVPLVAGTDGAVPGHSLLRSLELFVQAGLSPMEAIRSATLVAATAMGMERESGTVEVGKRADLVVLDADPLADISKIRTARWVVSNGRMYSSAALWRAAGFATMR